jgi:hypothetical protein
LPSDIWGPSTGEELAALLRRINGRALLPTSRALLFKLLLSELDAPFGSDGTGKFLRARIQTLMRFGAVEQAYAMIDGAGTEGRENFALYLDLALLIGQETRACEAWQARPALSDDAATRIFCLARLGDWSAAALSFETSEALGLLDRSKARLMRRFLDVELDEDAARLRMPRAPSPLEFHLFEAIGEPLPTTTLPLAYAHADLRDNSGWKAQVEAAERLVAAGALPANRMLGLFTENRPAASGGVWDRIAAWQAFDRAVTARDAQAVAQTLAPAWEAASSVGVAAALADLYAARLDAVDLADSRAAERAFRMALLTEGFEARASGDLPPSQSAEFLAAIARGTLEGATPPSEMGRAIAEAFTTPTPPSRFTSDIERRAIGAALLRAIALLGSGREGNLVRVTEALQLLRFLGLEREARRTALELMILDGS